MKLARPKAAPQFELPEAAPLTQFDPFSLAKQFDAMRTGAMAQGPAPFVMPQPKPIQYGGTLAAAPGASGARPVTPSAPMGAGNAPPASAPGAAWAQMDWGAKTATFQQQFPSLRHTSGYRDPEHNAATPGASPTSYHMQKDANGNARANDYVGSAKDMAAAAAWAKANGAREVLIHNAGTGQHLHVAW